jgi:glycosyltransferase involved in cell wall biosynthesis
MIKRIGFLSTYNPERECGVGKYTANLVTGLSKLGHWAKVVAICGEEASELYEDPAIFTVGQDEPIEAWEREVSHMLDMDLDFFVFQHEYGIGDKDHFVAAAKKIKDKGIPLIIYLHTVLGDPNDYQRETIQELAKYADSFVVHTRRAVDLLRDPSKYDIKIPIENISHGVRLLNPNIYDRLRIKRKYGAIYDDSDPENPIPYFLLVSLGFRGPNKGHVFDVQALARLYEESCTEEQRNKIKLLILGECHPNLKGHDRKAYEDELQKTIREDCKLRTPDEYYKTLYGIEWDKYDVIIVDKFLTEAELREGYTIANVLPMLYYAEQSGSGIFADAFGSRRIVIATKVLESAVELLNIKHPLKPGVRGIGDHLARGFLVDPGKASVEQAAEVIDYLAIDEHGQNERLNIEERAHRGGFDNEWDESSKRLMRHVEFLYERPKIITGRGPKFTREKPSIFEEKHKAHLGN